MFKPYLRSIRAFSSNARKYLLSSVLHGLGFGLVYLFFNLYVLALGHDQAFVGALSGVTALVTALASLPIGLYLPRLGFRRGLVIGLGLLLAALVGWIVFPTRWMLVLGSCLLGAGSSFLHVSSSPLMVAVTRPEERTHLFGVQFGLNTVAGVAANLLGGYLPRFFSMAAGQPIEGAQAYQAVLWVAVSILVLSLGPILRLRRMEGQAQRLPRWSDLAPSRDIFGRLLTVQVILSLGAGMLMPFVNVFYRLQYGIADARLGTVFAVSSLMTGIGSFLAPLVADRLGKVRSIVVTQALSIPFLLLMGFAPSVGASAIGFVIRTALMNMSTPVMMAYAMSLVPGRHRPLAASLMTLSWNGGWAVASWISGRLQVTAGFAPLFAITCSLYITVIVSFYLLFRGKTAVEEPEIGEGLPLAEDERI